MYVWSYSSSSRLILYVYADGTMEAAAHRVCVNKPKRVLVYTAVHIRLPWRRVFL